MWRLWGACMQAAAVNSDSAACSNLSDSPSGPGTASLMLALLRRLFGGQSGAPGSTRVISAASGSMEERLYACLFPGQRYSPAQATLLAGRLREVAESLAGNVKGQPEEPASKKRKKELRGRGKDLDFSAYQQRYVALELLYLGHEYGGFARQDHMDETIEGHLFSALRQTRLVPAESSWQDLRYSRGGRTDKGVSALGQVVALLLRSSGRPGQPVPAPEAELDYPSLLNRVLPRDIRVLGWTDVPEDFSARFSAEFREYKYLIAHTPGPSAAGGVQQAQQQQAQQAQQQQTQQAQQHQPPQDVQQPQHVPQAAAQGVQHAQHHAQQAQQGALACSLDIDAMRKAAAYFLGEHDFRNFCKVDVAQVQNFKRSILEFRLEPLPGCAWGGRALLQLHIRGTAFLWHQVRCMAAVLLMVGRGEEQPEIVQTLLDTQRCPRKPQFNMASEEPLLLYSCDYGGLQFRRTPASYGLVRSQLEDMLTSHLVRAGLLHTIQQRLAGDELVPSTAGIRRHGGGSAGPGPRHIPLLLRAKEPAVEERLLKVTAARGAGGTAGAAAAAAHGGNGSSAAEEARELGSAQLAAAAH